MPIIASAALRFHRTAFVKIPPSWVLCVRQLSLAPRGLLAQSGTSPTLPAHHTPASSRRHRPRPRPCCSAADPAANRPGKMPTMGTTGLTRASVPGSVRARRDRRRISSRPAKTPWGARLFVGRDPGRRPKGLVRALQRPYISSGGTGKRCLFGEEEARTAPAVIDPSVSVRRTAGHTRKTSPEATVSRPPPGRLLEPRRSRRRGIPRGTDVLRDQRRKHSSGSSVASGDHAKPKPDGKSVLSPGSGRDRLLALTAVSVVSSRLATRRTTVGARWVPDSAVTDSAGPVAIPSSPARRSVLGTVHHLGHPSSARTRGATPRCFRGVLRGPPDTE